MGGFLVALTSFLTTYATSKKQALQHGYHIDASQAFLVVGSMWARELMCLLKHHGATRTVVQYGIMEFCGDIICCHMIQRGIYMIYGAIMEI